MAVRNVALGGTHALRCWLRFDHGRVCSAAGLLLGGDSITTSGLAYDADGNHTFLENNRGQKQWKQMQRQLNKALDSIATRSDNPAEALQVEVMAMGESSDANFPAIYADLFGNRTFDNSKGGWSL